MDNGCGGVPVSRKLFADGFLHSFYADQLDKLGQDDRLNFFFVQPQDSELLRNNLFLEPLRCPAALVLGRLLVDSVAVELNVSPLGSVLHDNPF